MSDENNSPVGLNDAARLIEALDAPAANVAEKPKKPPVEQVEEVSVEETDDDAGEAEDETAEDSSQELETDTSEEPETEADEPEDAEEPEDLMLTVKVDGKSFKVTAKEAAEGYMRQADYSRKTQEVAHQRKEVEQVRGVYSEKANRLDEVLPLLVQKMEEFLPSPPDESLLDTDPVAFIKQKTYYDKRVYEMQVAREAAEQRKSEKDAEDKAKYDAYLVEASRQLPELIPEWKDAKKAQSDKAKMRDYLKQWWSPQEIEQAADPRMLMLAKKAMERDELVLNTKKIRPVAPLEKQVIRPAPTASPSTNKLTARAKDFRAAKNRLTQSGSLQDAADAIKALL
jgi:hypothetical protein